MNSDTADPASIRDTLLRELPPTVRSAVDAIAANGGGVYAVGGAVRDVLLGRPVVDLDLATESDAIDIVRASLTAPRVTEHKRFRTASMLIDGARLDFATCRTETYARPGALPSVNPASIEADLSRRDFSVNALALRLDGPSELLDPVGGLRDIRACTLRALHDASFRDDPTRMFRAFRYATRLEFTIEPETRAWLRRDRAFVGRLTPERVRRELELLLREETAASALTACREAGLLTAVHTALSWTDDCAAAYASPPAAGVPRLSFGFALLAHSADQAASREIVARLRLRRSEAPAVTAMPALRSVVPTLRRPGAKPSGVVVVLDRYPLAAVAAFAMTERDAIAARLALRYLEDWRHERPILRGNDLLEMGVPEGPRIEQGLQLVRAARLDGWASDRDDERALVMRFAKSIRDSTAAHGEVSFNGDHAN